MRDSLNSLPQHRWLLRIVLCVVLLALLLVGSDLEFLKNNAAAPTTTSSSTTTTTAGSSGTTGTTTDSTTTTTSIPAPTLSQSPVSDPLTLNEPARGCGFAMASGATSTSTTSPTSTTTTANSSTTTTSSTSPTSGTTTSTPSQSGSVPIRVVGHCTVLEIGDSLGNDLGWGLARELASTHALRLVQKDKSASGLVASWFYNWPEHEKTLLAQYHPDLVIICVGGDDEQGLKVNGNVYDFDSPQWATRYTALIRDLDTMATKAGSYVLWVGLPVMGPNIYREGAAKLNALYLSVATTVPGVTYLPSWDLFANAQGQYENAASVNHVRSLLRSSDEIHLSFIGENVIATFVADEIASIYHVSVKPSPPAYITN